MHADRASNTAGLVAWLRALATLDVTGVRDFHDPTAAAMLPPRFARVHHAVEQVIAWGGRDLARRLFGGGAFDLVALRTQAIDAALEAAVAAGCAQLVILGAGLDGRAWRMAALAGVDVFEVDHPATQAYKRGRTERLPARARSLRFVPVDFERDSLAAALAAAGQRADRPTVWIWEGVIVYLTRPALRATLGAVRARSAPGSRLLAQYREPSASAEARRLRRVLAWWREPHIGELTRADLAAELVAAGFTVASDTGASDWRRGPVDNFGAPTRLAVASVDDGDDRDGA